MPQAKKQEGYGKLLMEEPFYKIYSDFKTWRIDDFIRMIEKERRAGRVLAFVRGLRLSAHLIYIIRTILSGSTLAANWGHILDENNEYCSRECDVIIHEQGHIAAWNGNKEPIMDFKFIEKKKVRAVISCKSYITSSDIDMEYCPLMTTYSKNIWLFAECCGPRSFNSIEKKALDNGYNKVWRLYSWSKQLNSTEPNTAQWNDFILEVRKMT